MIRALEPPEVIQCKSLGLYQSLLGWMIDMATGRSMCPLMASIGVRPSSLTLPCREFQGHCGLKVFANQFYSDLKEK
jgi:hypothetical protein